MSLDWNKPIRFERVQNDDHATFKPQIVGTYRNKDGRVRHVIVARSWDTAASFLVYDDDGEYLFSTTKNNDSYGPALGATGIFGPALVNGEAITTKRVSLPDGGEILATYEGERLVKSEVLVE